MLADAELVAFVPTTDLDRAQEFYCTVLGLRLVETSPYALVLRAGSTAIRVTKVDRLSPQPFTVLGWEVADIEMLLGQLSRASFPARRYPGLDQDDNGVWTTPGGDRVAWFSDPDGNVLSLTQLCQR